MLAIFFFVFVFVLFIFREREIDQSTRFPGVTPIPSTQLPIQTGVSAPTAAEGGWFWVLLRALDCLDPSLKSEVCSLRETLYIKKPGAENTP